MELMVYKETWCDYLTPCIYIKDVMIGDYECEHCKYFKGRNTKETNIEDFTKAHNDSDKDYYRRYFLENLSYVKCSFREK